MSNIFDIFLIRHIHLLWIINFRFTYKFLIFIIIFILLIQIKIIKYYNKFIKKFINKKIEHEFFLKTRRIRRRRIKKHYY